MSVFCHTNTYAIRFQHYFRVRTAIRSGVSLTLHWPAYRFADVRVHCRWYRCNVNSHTRISLVHTSHKCEHSLKPQNTSSFYCFLNLRQQDWMKENRQLGLVQNCLRNNQLHASLPGQSFTHCTIHNFEPWTWISSQTKISLPSESCKHDNMECIKCARAGSSS